MKVFGSSMCMISKELCIAKREMATRNGNGHAVGGSLKTGAGKLFLRNFRRSAAVFCPKA